MSQVSVTSSGLWMQFVARASASAISLSLRYVSLVQKRFPVPCFRSSLASQTLVWMDPGLDGPWLGWAMASTNGVEGRAVCRCDNWPHCDGGAKPFIVCGNL